MRWLHPTLLYLAGLAVVPLLLHFLMRERVRRVVFTAVRFLRSQGAQALTRRRWVEWFLTAVRAACVVVLVIAFARPFFPDDDDAATPGPGERELLVVLLDTSRSMSFGRRFDEARATARRLIRSAGEAKELKLVTFADAGNITVVSPRNVRDALGLLDRAGPSAFGTDIVAALDRVFTTIGSRRAGGQVHLISDLQITGIARNRDLHRLPKGFRFHVHTIGGKPPGDSVAVAGGALSTEVTPEADNVKAAARVLNRGKAREVEVLLTVDGKAVSSRRVPLPQNGEAVVSLSGTVREIGDHAGQLLVKDVPVALKGDNRLCFVARVVHRIRVAVVNGNPSGVPEEDAALYVVTALNAGQDTPIQATAHNSLPPLEGVDVVVLAGVASLPAPDLERLTAFVRQGGGVLIGLGPGIQPEPFNASIGRIAPARLRRWRSGDGGTFLSAPDPKHPLIQRVAAEGSDLTTPRFRGTFELKDSQDARVIARFHDAGPALLEKRQGEGTVMMLAAALDRRAGDFPLRAIYVPFLRETAKLLSARGERAGALALGEPLPVPADGVVECPDGSTIRGRPDNADAVAAQPGFYRIKSRGRTELIAVNVDPAESDLTPAAASDIESIFSAEKDVLVRKTSRGYELVLAAGGKLRAERRWNIGWWCLILLVALGTLELWLARIASRK